MGMRLATRPGRKDHIKCSCLRGGGGTAAGRCPRDPGTSLQATKGGERTAGAGACTLQRAPAKLCALGVTRNSWDGQWTVLCALYLSIEPQPPGKRQVERVRCGRGN
ncbi:hypothetical protein NN561_006886 [Cricetulus griseus]